LTFRLRFNSREFANARTLVVLAIAIACIGCSTQAQEHEKKATHDFSQRLASEKRQALSLVESLPDAKHVAIKYSGEKWSVESEYEDAMASEDSNHVYCPHEYDVYYGQPGTDPNTAVWSWHVNVVVKKVSAPVSWAWMLSPLPIRPSPGFEEGDRVNPCWDGKPPAVAYPEDSNARP
jgi:hypothetical protein